MFSDHPEPASQNRRGSMAPPSPSSPTPFSSGPRGGALSNGLAHQTSMAALSKEPNGNAVVESEEPRGMENCKVPSNRRHSSPRRRASTRNRTENWPPKDAPSRRVYHQCLGQMGKASHRSRGRIMYCSRITCTETRIRNQKVA